jgi:hypothetical protein
MNKPEKTGVGCATQTLIEVAERNWNTTREGSLTEIVDALAGSFGVEVVRDAIDIVEKKRAEPASQLPPWRSK